MTLLAATRRYWITRNMATSTATTCQHTQKRHWYNNANKKMKHNTTTKDHNYYLNDSKYTFLSLRNETLKLLNPPWLQFSNNFTLSTSTIHDTSHHKTVDIVKKGHTLKEAGNGGGAWWEVVVKRTPAESPPRLWSPSTSQKGLKGRPRNNRAENDLPARHRRVKNDRQSMVSLKHSLYTNILPVPCNTKAQNVSTDAA